MNAGRKNVAIHTLGCRLNQGESEAIASDLRIRDYVIVDFDAGADVYILNTCTVTSQADRKSRNLINRTRKQANNPLIIVTGCFVEHYRQTLQSESHLYYVSNRQKAAIPDLIDAHFRGEIVHPESLDQSLFSYIPAERIFRTRALIKIQDGCNNYCTFCIIPFVRGTATSRPQKEIVQHIENSIESGSKEIILTGVNMSRYNDNGTNFTALLCSLLAINADFRIRISSLEPEGLDAEFLELLHHPKLCPHLHLCLQSGSEKILLKMRRCYTARQFSNLVEDIRKKNPLFNISTDIIAGFPGESKKDFADSCALARDLCFSHIHTFPYSMRSNTRASRMEDTIAPELIKERCEIVRAISEENTYRYRLQFIGKEEEVLVEQNNVEKNTSYGLGRYYLPIILPENKAYNSFQHVRVVRLQEGSAPCLHAEFV